MRIATTYISVLLICAGCGKQMPVAPVAGIITLGGKPLAGATITTQPIATDTRNPGPGSFGKTDAEGRFELELVQPAVKGAIIGEHRVMIAPASDDAASRQPQKSADGEYEFWTDDPQAHRAAANSKWPKQLSDGSLHLTVPPEGKDNVRFDLTP